MPTILFKALNCFRPATFFAIMLAIGAFTASSPVCAQKVDYQTSVGVLVGRISGITVKTRLNSTFSASLARSYDLNISTNFDDYALLSSHIMSEKAMANSPLTFYSGPGLTAGIEQKTFFGGVSGIMGLFFSKPPYEVFLQGMPRLYLRPNFDGRFEGATGLRVYF